MSKPHTLSLSYRLQVLYRVLLVFGLGYVCMVYLNFVLIESFLFFFDKPESIYLAAFISIFFYLIFVLVGFCTPSLSKLTGISTTLCALLLGLNMMMGQ